MSQPMMEPAGGAAPMLRPLDEVRRYAIGAVDGDIGTVADAYFDDASWTIRYLVVDTGRWLPGRHVLLSPHAVAAIDADGERIVTNLTKQQVRDAPGLEAARPVSRQHEAALCAYYGHPQYWDGPYRWGAAPYPFATLSPPPGPAEMAAREAAQRRADPHLRSAREVIGYGLSATDGDLGHVEDILVDEASWAIRYFVVDPQSWWPGPHVIIPTEWITGVSWSDRAVRVDVSRDAVRNAPEYVAPEDAPPVEVLRREVAGRPRRGSRDYEQRLHEHYGRPGYWERDPRLWMLPPAA
jgi:hypothetical protein